MSSSESEDLECPLCMEEMDIDDRGFYPCECGYQICRFCHNRISEDYGGRCPACRRLYSEQTPRWKPISPAQVAKIKNEKKAKEREKREIESNSRRHLANVRVVQKNLVYVIGLPSNLSSEDILRSHDYFGQFGRISKIVINRRQTGSSSQHPTVGVYVTYTTKEESTRAINAVDGSILEGRVLRATFGTTKYCSYYLRNIPCQNPGCMYLHEPGEEADSFTKEDLAANRAGLREDHDDDDDLDDIHHHHHHQHQAGHRQGGRIATHSPGGQPLSGRVQVVPASSFSGFQNSRPQSTAPVPSSSSATQLHAAPPSVSRVRKSSDINGARPRSVEPHGTDHDAQLNSGSALPATASWASRAMAKKPAGDSGDSRSRRSESGGGTMTLRITPSSRGKPATVAPVARTMSATAASAGSSIGASGPSSLVSSLSASNASRDRSKSGVSVPDAASNAATTTSSSAPGPQGHHPALQQMSRERKQQLRHQSRASQKAAESGDSGPQAKPDVSNQPCAKDNESQPESDAAASAVERSNEAEQKTSPEQTEAQEKQPCASEVTASDGAAAAGDIGLGESAGTGSPAPATDSRVPEGESAPISHTNSALSFQNITDSLFAQLNAKVSTPSSTALPTFAAAPAFEGHPPGLRANASYPISSVDPLLFTPSIGSESTAAGAYGRAGGALSQASSFSLFGGVNPAPAASAQWGGLGAASGQFTQSPLSALRGDTPLIGGALSRDAPISSGIGSASRQRSRWDFVQPDEASAQAELQSVLGRSNSGSISASHGVFGSQQGSSVLAFTNSRDLGLFATPVQNDYTLGGPWGGFGSQGAESVNAAPFPPPGFGGSKAAEGSLQAESRTRSPLVSRATPISGVIGSSAPNNLLSRLIGQSGTDLGSTGPSSVSENDGQQFQDPAILSSYMAAAVAAASPQQQQQQQQQQAQQPTQTSRSNSSKTDPNVLNSLLARLHLGQGSAGSPLSPMPLPAGEGVGGGKFVSGRMMLSDIERKLDAARREAQELQAQLSTVIGQNQSAMWALVNGGNVGGSPSAGGDAAPVHQGVGYSGGGSAARK
ncbi:transcriptional repressor general negative regulator of transcription subunit 4 [Coemansia interrupta]|uniref:Transcriptional repressor general negative regulator of transcription subunit 4 n=1 Tax=Coemansia interrupta TaxID=1126814 RepID=A0A9W8HCV7_9FUNG|nr:transcriptional repressor general negative regulator of transcription subunit 4 [Coemansia interrupta]